MKNKIAVIMLACMLAVSATACGESGGASNGERGVNEETEPVYEDLPDSQSLAEQIKAINSNVGGIEAFDESTDPNGNLGRPGEYISKADFEDTRLEQYGEYLVGGTIETFENESDCNNRYKYLKTLQDSSLGIPQSNRYHYGAVSRYQHSRIGHRRGCILSNRGIEPPPRTAPGHPQKNNVFTQTAEGRAGSRSSLVERGNTYEYI